MARRFRRRGGGGIWFPTTQIGLTELAVERDGASTFDSYPIVAGDQPITSTAESATTPGFLSAATHTGYSIKRIVGKVYVGAIQATSVTTDIILYGVRAAIFVDKVDAAGVPQNLAAWNSFGANVGASQKRYLWKRQWVLKNDEITSVNGLYDAPLSNTEYGSVHEGGHIDVKVGARVSFEERLFFFIEAFALWQLDLGENGGSIAYETDLRVYARPVQRFVR